jgi:hypothetical protein
MTTENTLRAARAVAASILVVAALNHGLLAARGVGNVPRHAAFVGINLAAALLVAAWPRYALGPIAILAAQQTWGHGGDFVESLRAAGPIDVASLFVVLFFPALIVLLVASRRASRPAPRRAGPPPP